MRARPLAFLVLAGLLPAQEVHKFPDHGFRITAPAGWTLIPPRPGEQWILARFMSNPEFVQQCFVTNEPYFARQRGAEVGALLIASDTYEPYRVMITGTEFLAKHPDLVGKFVRASVRGWVDYLTGDPAPGNALLAAKRSDLPPEFMAYSIKAMNDYKLVAGDPAKGEFTGQLTAARLQKQINLLQEVGVLDKPVKVEDVATFEFIQASPVK